MPLIGLGGLVVAGGDGAVLLEAVEAAFDHVAASVGGGVEGGRSAAGSDGLASMGLQVDAFRDGRGDAAVAEVCTDGAGAVALVREHTAGPCPGSSSAGSGRPDPGQHPGEDGAVVDVAGGQHHRGSIAERVCR